MKARQQKNLRQTADHVLAAIDHYEPRELTMDELVTATGRKKGAVMDAVDLLKSEGSIASYTDSPRRFRRSIYTAADVGKAA